MSQAHAGGLEDGAASLSDLAALAAASTEQALFLERLGFFDRRYYLETNPDIAASGVDPFEHFYSVGYKEGRCPNFAFDTQWYLDTYRDVEIANINALLHYVVFGEHEGRKPNSLFDLQWYRHNYDINGGDSALLHYLNTRKDGSSPIPQFDGRYYLSTYKDVAAAGADPFEHYMTYGFREGRNPSAIFDANFYVRRYLHGDYSQNPLLHYVTLSERENVLTSPAHSQQSIPALVRKFSRPGEDYEERRPLEPDSIRRAKVLAYYLPQFHPIAENDKWWGAGFTEWTNIARALPRFENHFQPRIPRDLGFYNLLDLDVIRKQVALAKGAGVYGFVYYYYNFNNHRLLEKPLEQFLAAPDIDMPFALMWANENWTRRWDGLESEILIRQDYRVDDDLDLCKDFIRHFRDARYIRVSGRPLLMIYRPGIIPNAKHRISAWRNIFREFGEEPIIVMGQAFNDVDPRDYGLDGAIEFPPHKLTTDMSRINGRVKFLDDHYSGNIFSYDEVVERSLTEAAPEFPLIKTAIPSWDNDARREGGGLCIQGSTPKKYERWLGRLIDAAARKPFFGEPFVCVNAWNEWCEGAYLEPDVFYGSAYLNATGRAVTGATKKPFRLLLVGHDAFPSGAQHLLLNLGKTIQEAMGLDIHFVLLEGGALEESYRAKAPVTNLKTVADWRAALATLVKDGFLAALVNTCASGSVVPTLIELGVRTVLLVHELPQLLNEKSLEASATESVSTADVVVFPSSFVQKRVLEALGSPQVKDAAVRPQGLYRDLRPDALASAHVREALGAAAREPIVLGVGYADLRKGFDLFLQAWRLCQQRGARVHFCWIGGMDAELHRWLASELELATATGTFHVIGYRDDLEGFYSAANVFALTSREDPFPSVALEALSVGVPVVAFDNSGGIPEFLKEHAMGEVAAYGDAARFADAVMRTISRGVDPSRTERMRSLIEERFSFVDYARDLVARAMPHLPSVSVVIPNFNYADFLRDRLDTVFDQAHPVEEIVVLDDASTDNSVTVIEDAARKRMRDLTLIINETNSGSVFAQWARAAEVARGEFIWIAEADDLADPMFLSAVVAMMGQDPQIRIGFSDSRSIDARGNAVYASYKPYFGAIEPDALTRSEIFDGDRFVERFLSVKNVILNASSVVWRKDALSEALAACESELRRFNVAGDWRLYVECLLVPGARVAYLAEPLNIHRRHAQSLTHTLKAESHLEEIRSMHDLMKLRSRSSSRVTKAQEEYVREVRRQFGLAKC